MTDLRRRLVVGGRSLASYLYLYFYLTCTLLILVGVSVVGVLYLQNINADRLALVSRSAFSANSEVLQAMTDAQAGLRGYQISNDRVLLSPYLGTHTRTMAALTTLQESLVLMGGGAETARYADLEGRQRFAVEQWWSYAQSAVQDLDRGEGMEILEERALFDSFRSVNATLNEDLGKGHGHSQTIQTAWQLETVAVTAILMAALMAAVAMRKWSTRTISQPLIDLNDTITRNRSGESWMQASEDQGPLECRSIAAILNEIAGQNAGLMDTKEHALRMNDVIFKTERALRPLRDIQPMLEVLCSSLGEGIGADRVIANTVDAEHKALRVAQWHLPDLAPLGDMPEDLVPFMRALTDDLWLAEGFSVRKDFLAPEVQSRERARIFYREFGAHALITVPIGIVDQVVGVIYVLMVQAPREWTTPEVNVVHQVAAFAAQAIVEHDHREQQLEYVDRLEKLDRQKTDFLSTVSHELRTPLTSVSGYLELLRGGAGGELTGEQQKMLEVIDRNANRLHGLIENLLALNRIETTDLDIKTTQVPMRKMITDTVQEMLPTAKSLTIEFDVDAGPETGIVNGDEGPLRRAFLNIVANAIKFSHPGGLVTIRCTVDQGASLVLVTCQDRGIGIPADDQIKLFTRFYRASNATRQAIPGTGLGLSIAKQIVEAHGGNLRLTSVEGEGTTVVMELPLLPGSRTPGIDTSDAV